MASIARCLRSARPQAFSTLIKCSIPRSPVGFTAISRSSKLRCFSASSISAIRKYTKDHEWIDVSADKTTGVMGISEYAAEALGDVVYVELPEEGKEVAAGDAIGAVESVKSAADINAPVACRVIHVNVALEEKPGTLNQVPEDDSGGGGWIAKVELLDGAAEDLDALMDAEAYKAFTEEQKAESEQ